MNNTIGQADCHSAAHKRDQVWGSLIPGQDQRYPPGMGFDRIVVGVGIAGACLFGIVSCGDNTQAILCGAGTVEADGVCVPSETACGIGTAFDEDLGLCLPVPAECARGTVAEGDRCVPDGSVICDDGTTYNASSGQCQSDIAACGAGTVLDGVTCVSIDEAIEASLEEDAEPNDDFGLAGSLDVPNLTGNRTIYGCIDPTDTDGDGSIDIDRDSYRLTASGPSLVDISVDGIAGLSGGFVIRATSGALLEDGWSRTGLNLVSDTSRRQVFLPAAGDYLLDIVDGRSLLVDAPVGNGETCYLASLRNIALPAAVAVSDLASGTLGSGVHMLSYSAEADGDILEDVLSLTAPTQAASLAMVHMRAGRYAGGVQGGSSLADTTAGLLSSSNLLIVIEPEFNYALDSVPFAYSLSRSGATQLTSSVATSIAVGNALGSEMAWTEVASGDIVRLQTTDSDISVFSMDRRLSRTTQLCSDCGDSEFFYQAINSELLYLGISHASAVGSFDVTIEIERQSPTALAVDSALSGVALGSQGVSFVESVEEARAWTTLDASASSFAGNLQARRYPRDTAGFLDAEISPLEVLLASETPRAHIASERQANLWRVDDDAFDGTSDDETFDLSLTALAFANLQPTSATPVQLTALAIGGNDAQRFLLVGEPGQEIDLVASTGDSIDLSIAQLSDFEDVVALEDSGASGASETVRITIPQAGYVPLFVQSAIEAGNYDLSATIAAAP